MQCLDRARSTPAIPSAADPNAVELGVKFRSDSTASSPASGSTKGPRNTGTHVGNLWTADGTQLATGDLHQRDRLRAGSRSTFRHRCRLPRTPSTWPPTMRRTVAMRSTAPTSPERGRQSAHCISLQDGESGGNGVYSVRPRRLPDPDLECEQLLGRCGLRHQRGSRHHGADGNGDVAGRRCDGGRPGKSRCHGDLQRTDGPDHNQRCDVRAAGMAAVHLVPAAVTYDEATGRLTLTPIRAVA